MPRQTSRSTPRTAQPAAVPTTTTPWLLLGISKSTFYRLWARKLVPAPLSIPSLGKNIWRRDDILNFLERLPTLDQPRPARPGVGRPRKTG